MSIQPVHAIAEPAESLRVATLQEMLIERAARDPDLPLLHFLDSSGEPQAALTAPELLDRARSIAARLQTEGAAGQPVLLLFPPGLEYIEAFYGCVFAGAIPVPAYPPNPARLKQTLPRLESIVRDAGATLALTTAAVLPMVEMLGQLHPTFLPLRWIGVDAIHDAPGLQDDAAPAAPGDIAFLQYTSGSTATPKGVMVTHANLLYNAEDISRSAEYRTDDVLLSWLPTFHDLGLVVGLILPIYKGLPIYLMSPLEFLQRPSRWVEFIARLGATQSAAPNFAFDLTVRRTTPELRASLDLSRWRKVVNAAEPVRKATLERFIAAFAPSGFRGEALLVGYGLAEATLKVTAGPIHYAALDRQALRQHRVQHTLSPESAQFITGAGKVDLDTEVCIVDPVSCAPCPADRIGEIWVRGPGVARGYWNNPQATRETFGATLAGKDESPWLRTGDLGFIEAGELFITGRQKDLIIVDGVNFYPQDVEWIAEESHPSLRKGCCAAFSVEDGEQERLVVVIEIEDLSNDDNRRMLVAEIRDAVRSAISQALVLRVDDVRLVKRGSVAKTSSGKIQRHASRAAYLGNELEEWRETA